MVQNKKFNANLLYMEKIKNPLLTTAEATYLGLKISYLHKLMMRHAIPYYKPMGKLCFFSQADLDHWLTCNRIASQKEIEQRGSAVSVHETHREEMSQMPLTYTRPPPLSGRT